MYVFVASIVKKIDNKNVLKRKKKGITAQLYVIGSRFSDMYTSKLVVRFQDNTFFKDITHNLL